MGIIVNDLRPPHIVVLMQAVLLQLNGAADKHRRGCAALRASDDVSECRHNLAEPHSQASTDQKSRVRNERRFLRSAGCVS